jgi:isopentenyl phosphate kinase
MFILKLGGSVITDKSTKNSFKKNIADRLSAEIKKANKEIILIHGAGSYGHILARKYDLNQGYKKNEQIIGFAFTHACVQQLNTLVLNSLQEKNIAAVSIPPHATMKLNDHKPIKMDYDIFQDCLNQRFTPVTFGDVILDNKLGFSICSGDLLMQILAKHFKPEKVIFVIDEDGLYSSNPKTDKNAEFISAITLGKLEQLSTSLDKHDDVTMGMKGKIDTIKNIASFGVDTVLLNGNKPDRLYKVLVGEKTKCTIVSRS